MDWSKLKAEYITTDVSYRKLADKYDMSYVTIARVGKAEDWAGQRKRHQENTLTKTLDKISEGHAKRAAKIQNAADTLLEKIMEIMTTIEIDTQSARQIAATLKDIKEIQMIKSDADMREQEARINNLRKQAEKDDVAREPIKICAT